MAAYIHKNALDQALDIAGSLLQQGNRVLQDEPDGVGRSVSGSQTAAAVFGTPDGNGIQTIYAPGYLFYLDTPGRYLRVTGAVSGTNNGTLLITSATLPSQLSVLNAAGVSESGSSITVDERYDYALEDDLNFARTDRRAIKGTLNFYDGIPTYVRPTATNVNVTASLQNIASKTTDAKALVTTRVFLTGTITSGTFFTVLNDTGMFPFADSIDTTGVPVVDGYDTGNFEAAYVEIIDPATEAAMEVFSGAGVGQRIFGLTFGSSGSEPNSVGVKFMRVAKGGALSAGVPYSWEGGHPLTASFYYGYRQRLDQLDESALRRVMVNGIVGDADMSQDIVDIRRTIDDSFADGAVSLAGLLTNTGNFFPFVNLPDASPSIVEALNTLNAQIGNRDYTGPYLTDGQTITASLQALSTAIASNGAVKRIIERLAADVNANTQHNIPGAYTYVPGTMSGSGMLWVFSRGVLRDPGTVVNSDDYAETGTGSVSFFTKQKAGDHINYMIF